MDLRAGQPRGDGGPIDNFKAVFGATHTGSQLGSTKIITLNSSSLTLDGNDDGVAQLTDLEQLRQAAKDPRVTGVLIATHVPSTIRCPTRPASSATGSRRSS